MNKVSPPLFCCGSCAKREKSLKPVLIREGIGFSRENKRLSLQALLQPMVANQLDGGHEAVSVPSLWSFDCIDDT